MWHWTNKLILVGALAILFLSSAPETAAQIVYGQPAAGNTRVTYYHWQTETDGVERSLDQFMIPLSGFVPIRDNFDLTFFVANCSNTYETDLGEYKLSGLGDLRVQASHSFADDRLLFSGTVNLPTGKKELEQDQSGVLGALAASYLDLPMRKFGEGFGFSLLVGGAIEVREGLRAGAGVAYEYVGSYTPYSGISHVDTATGDTVRFDGYNPGDVFSVNGGLDYERGATLWSLDLIFTQYDADKLNDVKTFRQSRQFDWRLRSDYVGERISLSGLVRYVWRGKNRRYDRAGGWIDALKLFGNEIQIAGELSYQFDGGWYAIPAVDFRLVESHEIDFEIDFDKSSVLGFGATIGKQVGAGIDANIGGKFYSGSANGGDIDISGYHLTFGLTATF